MVCHNQLTIHKLISVISQKQILHKKNIGILNEFKYCLMTHLPSQKETI